MLNERFCPLHSFVDFPLSFCTHSFSSDTTLKMLRTTLRTLLSASVLPSILAAPASPTDPADSSTGSVITPKVMIVTTVSALSSLRQFEFR